MIHTFLCRKCQKEFMANVPAKEMPRKEPCPDCKTPAMKFFQPTQVMQDSLKRPVKLSSLYGCPTIESRSDRRRAMKAHDRKYGTSLVEG